MESVTRGSIVVGEPVVDSGRLLASVNSVVVEVSLSMAFPVVDSRFSAEVDSRFVVVTISTTFAVEVSLSTRGGASVVSSPKVIPATRANANKLQSVLGME